MIRNDREYREAGARVRQEKRRLARQRTELKALGLGPQEVKRALDPMRSFHRQLEEEVRGYQKLRRGEVNELLNFDGIGQLLVSLRIARGFTQRKLARRMGVHETQISRDERNEYHGVTVERAGRILEALGVAVRSRVELSDRKKSDVA
jgi:DNA-binding XRE family transcriptional regulator